MAVRRLKTPLKMEDILKLKVGDMVLLSGKVYTARDSTHKKIIGLSRKGKLPVDLKGAVIYHCGPVVRKKEGIYEIVSAGPTTSSRMNVYLDEILSLGVRGIIGKGGMKSSPFKGRAVYMTFTGGAGALAAESIEEVIDVLWLEELGVPEAMWIIRVKDMPLIVAIDSHGRSLYNEHT